MVMKKRGTREEKEFDESVRRIVDEMGMNLPELVGRFMANCQVIEAQLKRYITKVDNKVTLKSLEDRKATLGKLIGMFTGRYKSGQLPRPEEELFLQWLPSVLELRNDVAHEFFLYDAASRKEMGEGIHRLNTEVIRKGLRMTEFCIHQLEVILKGLQSSQDRKARK